MVESDPRQCVSHCRPREMKAGLHTNNCAYFHPLGLRTKEKIKHNLSDESCCGTLQLKGNKIV